MGQKYEITNIHGYIVGDTIQTQKYKYIQDYDEGIIDIQPCA